MSLNNKQFTIISNNCWGAEVYKNFNLSFSTPFIGLYLYPDCYLQLITDFENLINSPLTFATKSKYVSSFNYPVGLLNNEIEIHFLHYYSPEEAIEKWSRRIARISSEKEKLFFKFDDRDGCKYHHLKAFHSLPFKNKISFTCKNYPEFENNIRIATSKTSKEVIDGFALFGESIKYFNLESWLNGNGIKKSFFNKLYPFIKQAKLDFNL